MKTLGIAIVLGVFLLYATPSVRAQATNVSKAGTSAAPFLEIPVGSAAIGMGGAFVSIANDVTALYWNPAGVSTFQGVEAMAVHTRWIASTRFDFAGVVLPLGDAGTLGASITSLGMDDMKVRTVENPEGTGEYFSAGDIAAGISYARHLTDRFAIGFTAKYIQQSIWHESAFAFAIDVGTTFRTDLLGGLTIGATLSNFGTAMKMNGRDARTFISVDPTKLGSNDRVPTDIELDSWELPLLFQIGVSTEVVTSDDIRWVVAADALHPSDNYESVNLGTEISYGGFLALRGGYHSLFLDQAEGGLSLGVGLASNTLFGSMRVRFDYAYRNMGRLDNVHVFSIGASF
jgi:Type IX secretion system protein PorV